MKKLVCELCGESDFVKVNGFFECQVCGAKYTLADAKNMFYDVLPDGTVVKSGTTASTNQAPGTRQPSPAAATARPVPTTVKKVTVAPKTVATPTAVNKIVSNVKTAAEEREGDSEVAPKPAAKVVVKPVVAAKPVAKKPVAPTATAKPTGPKPSGIGVETARLIQNCFILAQTAYDAQNFFDAENYANRIIELDAENCDAWLLKGNCAGYQTQNPTFRLLESINYWNNCLVNADDNEREDYLFTVRTNCIEVAIGYVVRVAKEFKTNPSNEVLTKIKEAVDFVEPMMKKANQTFGVDIITYEDKLASNIAAIVNEVSKQATQTFGKRKETQTDAAFQRFIENQDYCIAAWEYLMDLAKKHGTVTAILSNIVKMNETIIRSCGYKTSGSKLKESMKISMSDKNQRLENIKKAKKKLEDKFVDIRKRDKVDQKIKNEKYWETHQEEKQQLLDERADLDHQIFELENSKLKMPALTELKKLEEECIRLQVLKDNPTLPTKERNGYMEMLQKTRKTVVSKKREIASIVDPIDNKIEKMKKRMVNIDLELNQNR